MPLAAPKWCPRCNAPHLARCQVVLKQQQHETNAQRPSPASRGYGRRWEKARLVFLSQHPLCAECSRQGVHTVATVVDHIRPHRDDAELFWDERNWQGLCTHCHAVKTGRGE